MSNDKKLPLIGAQSADPLERLLDGDSAAVIDRIQQHLVESPGDEVAWLQLGSAYVHIHHWYDAADALKQAVDNDGNVLEARRMYARVLHKLRRLDEATFQLVRAKGIAPDDPVVARELGVAFYDKGLFDKALRELLRSVELDAFDAHTQYALGLAHERKGDYAGAIAAYRESVRIDPRFVDARRTLADALAAMGEMAAAVTELEAALGIDRTNTQIAMNLEVLERGLAELKAARLLGKSEADVGNSTLVQEGQLTQKGRIKAGGDDVIRYSAELAELLIALDADGTVRRLTLLLPDVARAAAENDDVFGVTVVSTDGTQQATNYATAVTVTFLREALGCPLTRASAIYAQLIETHESVSWGGASLRFEQTDLEGEQVPGLVVEAT